MKTKPSLQRWLKLSEADIDQFLDVVLPGKTRIVAGLKDAVGAVPADPKDDMIIAATLESQASYIVSEDKHLLALKSYQGITINKVPPPLAMAKPQSRSSTLTSSSRQSAGPELG